VHHVGQNNPIGVTPKTKSDSLPFHPYYTMKDGFAVVMFLLIFAVFVFYLPDALGHADNYQRANPMVTPEHIVPEWYFLPFYAILRAVPDKLLGVILMLGAIIVLFVLPWLDTAKVRSMRFRPTTRRFFYIFIVACFVLGWCGANAPDDYAFTFGSKVVDGETVPVGLKFVWLSRIATLYYFAFFIPILPLLGWLEKTKPIPESITQAVLEGKA